MEKHPAGSPPGNQSHDVTDLKPPKISDSGISRMDSSRWQSIASIPEEEFERHVEQTKQAKQELTSAGGVEACQEP